MGPYRRFYRQKRTSFAGAGNGAICEEATFSTSLSIIFNLTRPHRFEPAVSRQVGQSSDIAMLMASQKTLSGEPSMSKAHATRKPFETPQKSALGGRVFKISLKGIPPVNAKMWAQMVSHIFYFQPHNMPAFLSSQSVEPGRISAQ